MVLRKVVLFILTRNVLLVSTSPAVPAISFDRSLNAFVDLNMQAQLTPIVVEDETVYPTSQLLIRNLKGNRFENQALFYELGFTNFCQNKQLNERFTRSIAECHKILSFLENSYKWLNAALTLNLTMNTIAIQLRLTKNTGTEPHSGLSSPYPLSRRQPHNCSTAFSPLKRTALDISINPFAYCHPLEKRL